MKRVDLIHYWCLWEVDWLWRTWATRNTIAMESHDMKCNVLSLSPWNTNNLFFSEQDVCSWIYECVCWCEGVFVRVWVCVWVWVDEICMNVGHSRQTGNGQRSPVLWAFVLWRLWRLWRPCPGVVLGTFLLTQGSAYDRWDPGPLCRGPWRADQALRQVFTNQAAIHLQGSRFICVAVCVDVDVSVRVCAYAYVCMSVCVCVCKCVCACVCVICQPWKWWLQSICLYFFSDRKSTRLNSSHL